MWMSISRLRRRSGWSRSGRRRRRSSWSKSSRRSRSSSWSTSSRQKKVAAEPMDATVVPEAAPASMNSDASERQRWWRNLLQGMDETIASTRLSVHRPAATEEPAAPEQPASVVQVSEQQEPVHEQAASSEGLQDAAGEEATANEGTQDAATEKGQDATMEQDMAVEQGCTLQNNQNSGSEEGDPKQDEDATADRDLFAEQKAAQTDPAVEDVAALQEEAAPEQAAGAVGEQEVVAEQEAAERYRSPASTAMPAVLSKSDSVVSTASPATPASTAEHVETPLQRRHLRGVMLPSVSAYYAEEFGTLRRELAEVRGHGFVKTTENAENGQPDWVDAADSSTALPVSALKRGRSLGAIGSQPTAHKGTFDCMHSAVAGTAALNRTISDARMRLAVAEDIMKARYEFDEDQDAGPWSLGSKIKMQHALAAVERARSADFVERLSPDSYAEQLPTRVRTGNAAYRRASPAGPAMAAVTRNLSPVSRSARLSGGGHADVGTVSSSATALQRKLAEARDRLAQAESRRREASCIAEAMTVDLTTLSSSERKRLIGLPPRMPGDLGTPECVGSPFAKRLFDRSPRASAGAGGSSASGGTPMHGSTGLTTPAHSRSLFAEDIDDGYSHGSMSARSPLAAQGGRMCASTSAIATARAAWVPGAP
eukprot:NODE_808_length_2756_cov_5.958920.p1 GENE.NODE_808_length_2756_cov_5.958920~~NODE_808_length_2756_cov_5.958920.p1  ORF type:complete len:655 (-),score=138.57 NODE_808_length_2756_cov_5.958920:528-2492(-)